MTFNSWEFLLFYPIVALLYFVLPRKLKWPMLLVASYYFYACYQAELTVLIFGTTLISWIASNIISRTDNKRVKKLWLSITLIVCFGVLFFYKYFNFLSGSVIGVINMLGGEVSAFEMKLLLPVGISFYTFQTLSYVIDVYRGEVEPERNFFFYALFVSFFPQLVAGPIERPGNLVPQLKEPHRFTVDNGIKGGKHMLVGFFKKICVADLISVYVNAVYNDVESASAVGIIIATVLFAVQIYCDFSGYTDIAIGCARVMGIRLMKNFDHPYTAKTVKEFWSRWHISLSTWFKDYLYIPLGGNRCKKPRAMFNIFVVFLVSGLWHGANWTFVIWGVVHAIYQIIGTLTIPYRNSLIRRIGISPDSLPIAFIRRTVTFILVCFAWIFFRANTVGEAGIIMEKLFSTGWNVTVSGTLTHMGLDTVAIAMTALSIITLVMLDRMVTYEDERDTSDILVRDASFVYLIWIILFAWALLLSKDMMSTFIYFQF